MNALSFIIKNYPNAPTIESVKQLDYTKIKSGDNDLATTVAAYYNDGLLAKYLATYIISYYKTEDPAKQSFWGSDVSRATFVTRIKSTNNDLQWIYDMKGKCVGKSIIDPMLEYIKADLLLFIDQVPTKLLKLSVADGYELTAVQRSVYKAIDGIKDNSLKDNIIREISPHFYLNKTSLDEKEEDNIIV